MTWANRLRAAQSFRWLLICARSTAAASLCRMRQRAPVPALVDPPATMVQAQRRVESWLNHKPYQKTADVGAAIEDFGELQPAVVADEERRLFSQRQGMKLERGEERWSTRIWRTGSFGRSRSTRTRSRSRTCSSPPAAPSCAKASQFTLAPMASGTAEAADPGALSECDEWDPGVYGAEAASRTWYWDPGRQTGSRPGRAAGSRHPRSAPP